MTTPMPGHWFSSSSPVAPRIKPGRLASRPLLPQKVQRQSPPNGAEKSKHFSQLKNHSSHELPIVWLLVGVFLRIANGCGGGKNAC